MDKSNLIVAIVSKTLMKKKLSQYKKIKYYDFKVLWPHLIHKDLWNKVGGL